MNAGGLAEGIAESELFGHVKGAFTDARVDRIGCFEMADEGTLFLDEIANMPMRLQAKLLRVLQTGEIAARRLVAAALRQRARAVGDQRRPARRRSRPGVSAKICSIASTPSSFTCRRCATGVTTSRRWPAHFLSHYAARYRKPLAGFDADALRGCRRTRGPATSASWRTAVERAVLMSDPAATSIAARHLGLQRPRGSGGSGADDLSLEDAERVFIEKVLARHNGDVRLAAQQLGMSRSALYRRLQHYGVRS